MNRRLGWVAIACVILLVAAIVFWAVRPRPQRDAGFLFELLPSDADVYAIADLGILQSNPVIKKLLADPPFSAPTSDYQRLLNESGFHYQDDLKQLAVAKVGEDWVGVAVVNVDRERLVRYMESQQALKSQQGTSTVYAFGSVRPLRLTFLDDHQIAFSAGADPALLSGVLRRFEQPFAGDSSVDMLRRFSHIAYYPQGAGLWIVARMDSLLAADPEGARLGPFQFGKEWLDGSETLVARVDAGPLTLALKAEDWCVSAAHAERIASGFKTVLALLRAVPQTGDTSGPPNYGVLLNTASIEQKDRSVFANWQWDPSMIALLMQNEH